MSPARATGRVCLGPVPADFDPAFDLALGPWCFVGREDQVPGWEDLAFADAFPTPQDWVEADRLTRRLANALVPHWAERLNRRHGRSYSLRFWRVLLLNWLSVAVPPLWFRYRHVEAFVARHGQTPLSVDMAPDLDDWAIACSGDLMPTLWRADFDARLSSLALSCLMPPAWRVWTHPPQAVTAPMPLEAPNNRPSRLGRLIRSVFGRLAVQFVPGTRLARLPLSIFAAMLPRRQAQDHYHFDDPVADSFPGAFLDLLDRFLCRTLPHSFAEGFAALETVALAERYHPGRLLIDTLNGEDDATRIITAMAHERGERLVGLQHGGIYGTAQAMMAAAETEYRYHGFLTWGWSAQEDCQGRFVPVPSPELSAVADCHHETAPRLILVGGSMVVHGTRLGWLPKPGHYLSYRRAKLDFLGGLSAAVRQAVAYRPYRRNVMVLKDDEFVRDAFPDLALAEGDLNAALLGCRLAVIDHPITTMLVTLAANVPTILYWQPEAWPLARQAEPYFQALRDVGILHGSAAAAAAQADAVWGDVPAWWTRPEVQAARRRFVAQYARTSKLWWAHWLRALARL
ncbi:conserved hypothetical protein [Candidatus Terasakiella magnetica]|nr:conserved hypothetical protein [Candidatus Terasakiella magnetica]